MVHIYIYIYIWVWVKIRYLKILDGCSTKPDIHICGPTSVFHFDPHPYIYIYKYHRLYVAIYIGLRQSTYIIILVSCSDSQCSASLASFLFLSMSVSGFSHEKLFPRTSQPNHPRVWIHQKWWFTRRNPPQRHLIWGRQSKVSLLVIGTDKVTGSGSV